MKSRKEEERGPVRMKGAGQKRSPSKTPFPRLLFTILEMADEMGYSHIISWGSHGVSFVVHDRAAFMESVMPMYFSQTKYSSFQRQLSLYGFQHVHGRGRKKEPNVYGHERFLREQPDLLDSIVRGYSSPSSDSFTFPLGPPVGPHGVIPSTSVPQAAADSPHHSHNTLPVEEQPAHSQGYLPRYSNEKHDARGFRASSSPHQDDAITDLKAQPGNSRAARNDQQTSTTVFAYETQSDISPDPLHATEYGTSQSFGTKIQEETDLDETAGVNDDESFSDLVRSTEELLDSIQSRHLSGRSSRTSAPQARNSPGTNEERSDDTNLFAADKNNEKS